MIEFPKDFFWGAATSAYQVEGDNVNCDWWEWERRVGLKETSGPACRHYEYYRKDFDLAKSLNHNAHRVSVEWSRIEPEEGRFSEQEISHYTDVINYLRQLGIEPIVTLHHFTNPLWFARLGGWLNRSAPGYFLRFTEKLINALCDKVRFWVTINEPLVYVYHAYLLGAWPPQERSYLKAKYAADNLAVAHIKAYRLIHDIYKRKNLSPVFVSIAKNLQVFEPCSKDLRDRFCASLRDRTFNYSLIEKLIRQECLDFIGINYYTRNLVEIKGWALRNFLLDVCGSGHSRLKKNSLGWDIYPQGLLEVLLKLKRYNLPVFILENGICTEDDGLRWEFIYEHLENISLAMKEGLKVLGYIYWSLMDNYEWDKGFSPRFGLVSVDYDTFRRSIRQSARRFSEVCKTGILNR